MTSDEQETPSSDVLTDEQAADGENETKMWSALGSSLQKIPLHDYTKKVCCLWGQKLRVSSLNVSGRSHLKVLNTRSCIQHCVKPAACPGLVILLCSHKSQ